MLFFLFYPTTEIHSDNLKLQMICKSILANSNVFHKDIKYTREQITLASFKIFNILLFKIAVSKEGDHKIHISGVQCNVLLKFLFPNYSCYAKFSFLELTSGVIRQLLIIFGLKTVIRSFQVLLQNDVFSERKFLILSNKRFPSRISNWTSVSS